MSEIVPTTPPTSIESVKEEERYEPPKLKRNISSLYMVGSSFLPVFVRATCGDFDKYSAYMDVKKVVHKEDSVTQEKLIFPKVDSWIKVWKHIRQWAIISCENGHFYSLETCMGIVKNDNMTRAKCPSCRCKIKITEDISSMVYLFRDIHLETQRSEEQLGKKKKVVESSSEEETENEEEQSSTEPSEYNPEDDDDGDEEDEYDFDEEDTDDNDEDNHVIRIPIMRIATRGRRNRN